YQRVGEMFSSRAYNQKVTASLPYLARDDWTTFEGSDDAPGPWSFRYGWRNRAAHIGVIGSSDNHSQMPGANDDMTLDGTRFHRDRAGRLRHGGGGEPRSGRNLRRPRGAPHLRHDRRARVARLQGGRRPDGKLDRGPRLGAPHRPDRSDGRHDDHAGRGVG